MKGRLLTGVLGMFFLKVAYSGCNVCLSLMLTHSLGARGFGVYSYAMSWVVFLGVPASLGLDKLVAREVAVCRVGSQWGRVYYLLRRANRAGLVASLGLALAAALVAWGVAGSGHWGETLATFWVALLLIPIFTIMKIRQAALGGLHRAAFGLLPELLLHPILLSGLLVLSLSSGGRLTPTGAMGMTILSSLIAVLVGTRLLSRSLPETAETAAVADEPLKWGRSMLILVVMMTIQIFYSQTDTLLLGALDGPKAVGIYSVAFRGAQLISFFLITAVPVLGPAVAAVHATRDTENLQRLITRSTRGTFLLSLPVAIGLLVFGPWFLKLFGTEFTGGATVLAILSVGQIVNVAMGSAGWILMMTGHEADAASSVGITATVNFGLCLLLIPSWGPEGAAVAVASSNVLWNALLSIQVYRKLGVHATALGVVGWPRWSSPWEARRPSEWNPQSPTELSSSEV